jgi:iron complex outermembrane recepter protein
MRRVRRYHAGALAAALLAASLTICLTATAMASGVVFEIAAGSAPPALKAFAAQAHMQLLFDYKAIAALRTPAVKGTMEPGEALKILLRGSGFTFRLVNDHTIALTATPGSVAPTPDAAPPPTGDAQRSARPEDLVAQVEPATPAQGGVTEAETKKGVIDEVVVTGSRIPTAAKDTARQVQLFDRQTIELSGQTNVADFLNTLPAASLSVGEGGTQTIFGNTTVQLRGLPQGTTLVLIDGRRTETSGQQRNDNFFDLNNLPLAAVDHIEVVPDGSSAIYGSDAIAGVVNVVLKKNIDGFEANAQYGGASGIDQKDFSASYGHVFERGAISLLGSYEDRSALLINERAVANQAPGNQFPVCNPGNVFAVSGNLPGLNAPYAAVPEVFTGTPTVSEFSGTAGRLNTCNILSTFSLIPATQRTGALFQAHYDVTSRVQVFAQVLYSHLLELQDNNEALLFGIPGFQSFTVAAQNPYNPFGTTVGIAESIPGLVAAQNQHEDFFRPLIGLRGDLGGWQWELSALESVDWDHLAQPFAISDAAAIQGALNSADPSVALNPFIAGNPASLAQLKSFYSSGEQVTSSRDQSVMLTANGTLIQLPGGAVKLVVGGEYDKQRLSFNYSNDGFDLPTLVGDAERHLYSGFAEARVPVFGPARGWQSGSSVLTLTGAERYDNYSDFGGINTYQAGVEFRPAEALLLRGTHASAFQAPSLFDLYAPQSTTPGFGTDPETGQQIQYTSLTGGNGALRPMTGESNTYGFVFSSPKVDGLRVAVTGWQVEEEDNIQALAPALLIANEAAFPGRITRAANCPGMAICPIVAVNATALNFGGIRVKGVDYDFAYSHSAPIGRFESHLSATNVYSYRESLIPGAAAVNAAGKAQDTNDWAPKWKASLGLGWSITHYAVSTTTRYVGSYEDYESTNRLGGFALFDASFSYAVGQALVPRSNWLRGLAVQMGGVNLFNTLPKPSTYVFSSVGYDPAQSDIRGRFLYAKLRLDL